MHQTISKSIQQNEFSYTFTNAIYFSVAALYN